MPDYRDFDEVQYVAGLTFQSEFGTHEAGTIVKEAKRFQNLQMLVDNRFLFPYAPKLGYEYLPPYLFNHINLKEEVMAKLAGAPSPNPDNFAEGGKPEAMLQAEREADLRLQEINGRTEQAKEVADKAREDAAATYAELGTVDANPNVADKAETLQKLRNVDEKGEKKELKKGEEPPLVSDAMTEQADERAKQAQKEAKEAVKIATNSDDNTPKPAQEREVPDNENPDKAESKKPQFDEQKTPEETGKSGLPNTQKPGRTAQAAKSEKEAETAKANAKEDTAAKPTAAKTTAAKTTAAKETKK